MRFLLLYKIPTGTSSVSRRQRVYKPSICGRASHLPLRSRKGKAYFLCLGWCEHIFMKYVRYNPAFRTVGDVCPYGGEVKPLTPKYAGCNSSLRAIEDMSAGEIYRFYIKNAPKFAFAHFGALHIFLF